MRIICTAGRAARANRHCQDNALDSWLLWDLEERERNSVWLRSVVRELVLAVVVGVLLLGLAL